MPVCSRKIDIHAHAVITDCPDPHLVCLPDPESVLARYDRFGIEKGLLLPICTADSMPFISSTETVRQVADRYPDRFLFGMGLDPRMCGNSVHADFRRLIAFYRSKGAKSVGEVTANLYLDDPLYDNMLAQCAEMDMPVTVHISPEVGFTYGMVDEPGLYRLEKMLKKYPKLKILAHSPAFWTHMAAGVTVPDMKRYPDPGKIRPGRLWELFDKYGNLYGDLSGCSGYYALTRDEENGLRFLNAFSERMLFGCDFCVPEHTGLLAMWLDRQYLAGALSEQVYWDICRNNACRVLKLEE